MGFEQYILILSSAFMMSLYHCVGMCGGIVLYFNMNAYSSKFIQIIANITYFLGRMCGYVAIGAAFYLIGEAFRFSKNASGIILILLGVILILMAFFSTFYPKILTNILPNSDYKWYKNIFKALLNDKKIFRNFLLGILNGFLPCHLVYMFAIKATNSDTIITAILTMILFALGTFLPLFLLGVLSTGAISARFRNIAMKILVA